MSDTDIVSALGGPVDRSFDQVSSTKTLSKVLERRSNSLESSTRSSTAQPLRAASAPRQLPSAPSLRIPSSRPVALSSCGSTSPISIVSSMGTSPPTMYRTPLYTAPVAPQASELKAEEVQYDYPYDTTQTQPWTYSQPYTYSSEPVGYYNTSSCVDAANIIRTMRSDSTPMYQVDQGCAPLTQPYYNNNNNNNNHVIYPVTAAFQQQYSRI